MLTNFAKKIIGVVVLLVLISASVFYFFVFHKNTSSTPNEEIVKENNSNPQYEVIGLSVEGRKIESYTFGSGDKHIVFVGGIHGGYEWNSVVLAYNFLDYLEVNSEVIPENVTVSIIPSANPDGVFKVIGKEGRFETADVPADGLMEQGRFNSNKVDLNRNFDCKWKPDSTWKGNKTSGGTAPFSEPESLAIKNFVLEKKPNAVVFWHSQANAVYASECEKGILPETLNIMNEYSNASGYSAIESFDSYEVTGDAEGWLASIGIPAITVELKTHEDIEWDKNLAGIKALFEYYNLK
ncbi:MAG: hypothetical protein K9M15_02065 [Candidatus Marinimicrobia bacterium]|nr:hypothetical protein [Candidatus Neomarinimicrobiota bacterium]